MQCIFGEREQANSFPSHVFVDQQLSAAEAVLPDRLPFPPTAVLCTEASDGLGVFLVLLESHNVGGDVLFPLNSFSLTKST